MVVWDKKILWSFMFLLAGAVGVGVNYPDPVCAVKGSTVTLLCTFTPLHSVKVDGREVLNNIVRVRWCQNHEICHETTPSVYDSNSTNNDPRYKYLGDKKGNCTIQIRDIQKKDEATLRFRMEAETREGHFTDQAGVKVTVLDAVEMKIKSSSSDGEMRRGEHVTLHCTAACTFHQLELTWFKDGHALSESGPALQLSPLTAKDSGNYTCGLKTNIKTLSLPYSLHVAAADEEEGGNNLPLIVGVMSGVLLLLFTLILVVCIISRRRAAADRNQRTVEGEVKQKPPDNIYSNIQAEAEEGGRHRQETSQTVEDVSYASVQFSHKKQARQAEVAEDATIYSTVANRG